MPHPAFRRLLKSLLLAGVACTAAFSQWSILAPGKRDARPGNHRYVYLVFANPVPGKEAEFNDWYTNRHMGDLVQRPGWLGAQRFRLVADVEPKPDRCRLQPRGYLIVWDREDADPRLPVQKNRPSPAWGFDGSPMMSYEIMGPKITRPDGKGPTLPMDDHSFRPNRYILMDFENALPERDAEFNKTADQSIRSVLALPGWMAAQRYVMTQALGPAQLPKPKYLTIWETEALSVQAVNDTLVKARKAGTVKANPAADMSMAEIVYWEPITPYITRERLRAIRTSPWPSLLSREERAASASPRSRAIWPRNSPPGDEQRDSARRRPAPQSRRVGGPGQGACCPNASNAFPRGEGRGEGRKVSCTRARKARRTPILW